MIVDGDGASLPPLVSVVTPSLNQGQYIEEAIQSVLAQDYPRVEHIVVDGGSSDETLEILRRFPHLRWLSEPDDGQASAINKGFHMASGEIFAWLNALTDLKANDAASTASRASCWAARSLSAISLYR